MRSIITPIPDLSDNLAIDTDTYKDYHDPLYVPGLDYLSSYFHSRGGMFPVATLFGLQYDLHRYWVKGFSQEHFEEAKAFNDFHGIRFPEEKWGRVAQKGYLPIKLRAVPEGLIVPPGNVLMTAESTDPEFASIESFMETSLVRLWQPSTVVSVLREVKKLLWKYLQVTSDTPEQDIEYMFNDFGGRGVGTKEQARVSGMAPLLFFGGSDLKEGFRTLNHYYHDPVGGGLRVPGVPASEHSTVCTWGRDREFEMVKNAIRHYLYERANPDAFNILSCVADTYDVFNFIKETTSGEILDLIKNAPYASKFVSRPDSGEAVEVLPRCLDVAWENLRADSKVNSKGFRRLPSYYGLLQGDGIKLDTLEPILKTLVEHGYDVGNLVFGSGGGLHQMWNRDTQKWAFKASAARANGEWVADVRKDPITDPGKRSRAGRLDLIQHEDGTFETIALPDGMDAHPKSVMNTVFLNGDILYHNTWREVRERVAI